jgi:hypothetical protein
MSKHTPGPWECENYDNKLFVIADHMTGSPAVCRILGSDATVNADANLIAAAPDLLAALQNVMSWIRNWSPDFTEDEDWDDDRNAALAAIAKAEGENV